MTPEVAQSLKLKRLQTAEMAYRLAAYGICVDEGDEHRLPIVEYSPDASRKLLRLIADQLPADDAIAFRKLIKTKEAGRAYVERLPLVRRVMDERGRVVYVEDGFISPRPDDLRELEGQALVKHMEADIAESLNLGVPRYKAVKKWVAGQAAKEIELRWSPDAESTALSGWKENLRRARAAIRARLRRHGAKMQ